MQLADAPSHSRHHHAGQRAAREVDPIEANALHGGRMSVVGSIAVALQTVWSSGVDASLGVGYTRRASGIASWIGRAFRLRRRDLRVLVGCGAAAAIAGAFGAPLGRSVLGDCEHGWPCSGWNRNCPDARGCALRDAAESAFLAGVPVSCARRADRWIAVPG